MSQQLYFVRHGQTEWNAIQRMQGQWNSDLNATGRAQAEVNGQLLARLGVEALFASPLDRTRQTAEIVNRHVNLPVTFDPRIMEWNCGDWSGHLRTDIESRWAREWAAWRADPFHYRGPNCENYPDMIARSRPFLEELFDHHARVIAIVSHGMIGRVMVSSVLGHDEQQTLAYGQANDQVFRVTRTPDGHATVEHYRAGEGPFPGLE